jgi:hypothetical protein
MDQGSHRIFPVYVRGWENFPSGRRYERITRLEKSRQVSVSRVTDANGFAEYSLTVVDEPPADDSFVEFTTGRYGFGPTTPAQFDELHAELGRLSADCRK